MVTEQATFTFYKINKAGYYRTGAREAEFGSVTEMLEDLKAWAEPKTLKETKTFETDEERYPAYLVDSRSSGSDWALLLWNEVPSNGQRMPSLSEDSRFGEEPAVIMNPIQEGSIPGYATYFWFIPERNLMATVRLHNKLTSQGTLQKYLQCFLKQSSRHVKAEVVETEEGAHEVKITGYMANVDDVDEEKKRYYPRFSTSLIKNPGRHEVIRQKANLIKKIERVIELDLAQPEQLGLWQKMLDFIQLGANQAPGASTKIKYIVSPDVTLADVNQMIEDWDEDVSEVNDYGFIFQGEPNKTYWLSNSLSRTQFDLRLERENDEIVNLQSLLDELGGKKERILRGAGLL
ncbi:hypothetical protein HV243_11695 [Citrobacter sp. RHBSTW-00599]|uniref:hypothetical protein n=1 Tax=unclassified Citrobacter TaxID=2644389 RepID=UPI0015EA3B7C|nr:MULTISPECIES: hypothetical protein [unclassified Citrobacter]MBU5642585.1 hypothetical protein [Citrobacter sp. S46_ASV_140]QLY03097.1 hypothetical protein HV243_11695 [Citrobacter sp. RHBSTW-00599]